METSEEDLPPVPDAADMLRPVGEPGRPPSQETQATQAEVQVEDEVVDTRDVQERILEKLTEIQVSMMTIEDLLEQAVGGD